MRILPHFLRRLPYVFYALAILLGGWRYWNEWTVASESFHYADAAGLDGAQMGMMARTNALYWGLTEAAYLIANGALLHIAIAIFDKIGGSAE